MDGKNNQILDPKLKEAYDRVMGSSIPPVTPKPQPVEPTAATLHTAQPHTTPPPLSSAPQHPQMPEQTPQVSQHPHVAFSAAYVAPGVAKHEGKSPVSGKILIAFGVVFLVVYTLFWMKWFGMTLPFLG